jgi:hypothetical protein
MPELYVWYEAEPAGADAVKSAFSQLREAMTTELSRMADTRSAPEIDMPARLLKRADQVSRSDGLRDTWMEVWPLRPQTDARAFEAYLQDNAARVGLAALAKSGRHVERFVTPDEPARLNDSVA